MKDISLHILDIVQNSIVADAKLIEITIDEDYLNDMLTISIIDNGKGIVPELLAKITDPYTTTRTTRKVGLGIPLFKQNAERTGGYLNIKSELGKGASLVAVFIPSNIDCLTLGDVTGVIILLVSGNPGIDFIYNHKKNGNLYSFNTIEVKEILGNLSVSNPTISKYLKEMIQSNLDELQIGTLGY